MSNMLRQVEICDDGYSRIVSLDLLKDADRHSSPSYLGDLREIIQRQWQLMIQLELARFILSIANRPEPRNRRGANMTPYTDLISPLGPRFLVVESEVHRYDPRIFRKERIKLTTADKKRVRAYWIEVHPEVAEQIKIFEQRRRTDAELGEHSA